MSRMRSPGVTPWRDQPSGIAILLILLLACGLSPMVVWAENWPAWRGPTGLGYSAEKDLPLKWDGKTGENIAWKALLHGGRNENPEASSPGWSSPIVWEDRVFLTTAVWPRDLSEPERRERIPSHHLLCFRVSDGEQLWDTEIPPGSCKVTNAHHGYAIPTPVTDGKHVYALFGSAVLAAVDFNGRIVWRQELPYGSGAEDGVCSSPLLHGDALIVVGLDNVGLRALDKNNGQVLWEQAAKHQNRLATPAMLDIGGLRQLVHYNHGAQGIDPQTGSLLWHCRAHSSHASVAFGEKLLYVDDGRGGKTGVAVDPTGEGDVSQSHVRWETKLSGADGSSAIVVGKRVYRTTNPGLVRCWNLENGDSLYENRASRISRCASPVATADGRIYFASSGRTFVVQAGDTYEELAMNDLDDTQDYASAAISGGRIFIRGKSYLWCIGQH